MRKIILLIVLCSLFYSSCVFANSDKTPTAPTAEKLNTATKDLISCHVEFAKASIERECEKLNKKIIKFEERLRFLETCSNQFNAIELNNLRTKLLNKIQKYKNQIYNLKLLKSSTEIVDFTNLN